MAGAWGWYKALLRTSHHVGMHAAVDRRTEILLWHRELHNRLTTWADHPRTSPALLRQAIDDVVACEALAPSERDSLKAGYLTAIKLLDSPSNPGRAVPLMRFRQFWHPDYQLGPEQIQEIWDAWRSWRREPERSRRLIRLVTANWLAYLDLPVEDRPKPDPNVASFDFYQFGPQAPAQARALSPEALDRWFDTAYDAQEVLRYLDATGIQIGERANHADLLVLLGTELYHRDHGSDPPTLEALVGPYLKSLPAEYLDDAGCSESGRWTSWTWSRIGPRPTDSTSTIQVMRRTHLETLRRSFPTLMLLGTPLRWIGKSRRRVVGTALLTLAVVASVPLWWAIQLIGLPDIGDPFDVAAFRAFTIPDERNAYVLYRQAAARLKPEMPFQTTAGRQVDWLVSWSKLPPEARQWAIENREALAVYRRGSDLPDALGAFPKFRGNHEDLWDMGVELQYFETLALCEGSRLEEQGEMAGAWGWYRAALRTIHHVGMHGTVLRRGIAQRWHLQLSGRLAGWAADPRTTPGATSPGRGRCRCVRVARSLGVVHAQGRIPRRGPAAR